MSKKQFHVEAWLRKSAKRYRPTKQNPLRFLKAAERIAELRDLVAELRYDLGRALKQDRNLEYENQRLRIALRGSYDPNETEQQAIARINNDQAETEAYYAHKPGTRWPREETP